MGSAREVALKALVACHRQGAWADGALKRELAKAGLDSRDGALASRLCYGVVQQQMYLDFLLSGFSTMPLERLQLEVLDILRLGAYQLLFTTKIPPNAAVNESVNLAKKFAKNKKTPGFVNGILRNLDRNRQSLPALPQDPVRRISLQYSHPEWLVKMFQKEIGLEETEHLLALHNGTAPLTVQVNTLKNTPEELRASLEGEGVSVIPHPWLENCFILEHTGNLETLKAFSGGGFYVQDPAARLAVEAAGVKEGERVLDLCGAPGGKSFAAAILMKNQGYLETHDVYPKKVKALSRNALRLGMDIKTKVFDARKKMEGQFDLVMADVPCSGLGIIRKKPDIRYKNPENFKELEEIQREILQNAATLVKPGGRLLYATCTLRREENQGQIRKFLGENPGFTVVTPGLDGGIPGVKPGTFGGQPGVKPGDLDQEEGMVTLWPQIHGTDGFFFTVLRKEAEG